MSKIKGGRPRGALTKLQRRRRDYDALDAQTKQTYRRPGSNNDHKQT